MKRQIMPTIVEFLTSNSQYMHDHMWLAVLLGVVVPCMVVFGLIQAVAGASAYIERKVAADIQRRVGPNKCNPGAFLGGFARAAAENASGPHAGGAAKLMGMALKPAIPVFDMLDKV